MFSVNDGDGCDKHNGYDNDYMYDGDDNYDFVYTGDFLQDASVDDVTEDLERGNLL